MFPLRSPIAGFWTAQASTRHQNLSRNCLSKVSTPSYEAPILSMRPCHSTLKRAASDLTVFCGDGKIFLPPVRRGGGMTEKEIRKIVIETVCALQEQSGRPLPETVCDTLRPIGDFD